MPRLSDATFFVESSGEIDSPPASAVREFLVERGARVVTTAVHPLNPEAAGAHVVERARRGSPARRRRLTLPSRPPLTYPLDLLVPPGLPRADAYIGFNNLVCLRGLAARAAGRAGKVAYWAVDFVPERFGPGPLTTVYDRLDAHVCRSVDARFEVSTNALEGRNARHGLTGGPPTLVTPMGAWLDRVPHAPPEGAAARRIVWAGHMVERQGVGRLMDALGLLGARGVEFEAELAGRGPEEEAMREAARRHGISDRVRFLGYIDDHRRLESVLAGATVGAAPYDTTVESFTRYADPAKLKAYLAAGLPIVTTDVPPNAHEVAERGGGEVVPFEAEAIADALQRALDPGTWGERRAAALRLAAEYDWSRIVGRAMATLGYEV